MITLKILTRFDHRQQKYFIIYSINGFGYDVNVVLPKSQKKKIQK